jgi:hypothetical protein
MYIVFTGHRDSYATDDDLEFIASKYQGAVWVHGGAPGVDTTVEEVARRLGIETVVVRPDYEQFVFNKRYAPIARDKQMVEMADLVVAFYDGRTTGGTKFTKEYAEKLGKEVLVFKPIKYGKE